MGASVGASVGAGSEVVGSEVVGSEVVGSEVVGSEVVGSEVIGSEVVGSEVVGSEVVGSEVVRARQPGATHTHSSWNPHNMRSVNWSHRGWQGAVGDGAFSPLGGTTTGPQGGRSWRGTRSSPAAPRARRRVESTHPV